MFLRLEFSGVFRSSLYRELLRPRRDNAIGRHKNLRCTRPIIGVVELSGRILAIDYGSRRIGLAVTDPLGITAQGLETLQRKNKRSDFARLEKLLREYEVREIVLGYPLRMSGQEGTQSQKVAEFAQELRRRFQLPVRLWDERLTSAEANRLLREADISIRKRAAAVDRIAATLILQSFLQARAVETLPAERDS